MTNPDYTAIKFIIDRSGSMYSIKDDMEGGINGVIEEQKSLPGKATVDITYFDREVTYEDKFLSLEEASIKISPRGSTALYDAIVQSSTTFGAALAELPEDERPAKVLVIIVTDGHENSSQENTVEDVKKLITTQQDTYNWDFLFLGANQDAIETGASFGLREGSSMTYTADSVGTASATRSMSATILNVRSRV